MRKNKMMRLASVLLVAVLLSTCAISGTFAKYVTSATASDSARVAKFGIIVSATGDDCFEKDYDTTVISTEDVVAPGTKNDSAATFSISGSAEVSLNVSFSLGTTKDVFLKAGSYKDYTTGDDTTDTFTLSSDYYPVVFGLKHTFGAKCWPIIAESDGTDKVVYAYTNSEKTTKEKVTSSNSATYAANGYQYGGYVEIKNQTLKQINSTLTTASAAMSSVDPNYTFDDEFTLSWAWAFTGNDKADTALGQIAAGNYTGLTAGTNYCIEQAFDFSITVTQVD